MKNNIILGKTLEEYNKKYKNRRKRLIKYSKEQVEEFDKKYGHYIYNNKTHSLEFKKFLLENRKWALIGDTYYEVPMVPRLTWFRNLNAGVQIASCVLAVGVVTTAIAVPIALAPKEQEKEKKKEIKVVINGNAEFDKENSSIELNKMSYIAIKAKDGFLITGVTEVKVGGKVITLGTDWGYNEQEKKIVIKDTAMTSIEFEISITDRAETAKEKFGRIMENYSKNFQSSSAKYKLTDLTVNHFSLLCSSQGVNLTENDANLNNIEYGAEQGINSCKLVVKQKEGEGTAEVFLHAGAYSSNLEEMNPDDSCYSFNNPNGDIIFHDENPTSLFLHVKDLIINKNGYVKKIDTTNVMSSTRTYIDLTYNN